MTFGEKLKAIRARRSLSQDELANLLGTSKQVISRYETGQRTPKITTAAEYAKILGISLSALIDDANVPAIPSGFIPVPEMEKVPLVGSIACGQPILAEENVEEMVDAPAGRGVDFCLICKGDSMIDAGIHDGDIVYIRQQTDVENGEIAAVRIGDEATLKRVYKSAAGVMLAPANAAYTPQMYGPDTLDDIQIEGKAVGWTHWI